VGVKPDSSTARSPLPLAFRARDRRRLNAAVKLALQMESYAAANEWVSRVLRDLAKRKKPRREGRLPGPTASAEA
jgi:hypothetical protein